MTLGDRVAVMRGGIIQQVDTPKNLYERPRNLFVAGFIGSPSMNFLPAHIEGDTIKLPFGDAPIPDELRSRLQGGDGKARDVIAGVRPEHFEDANVEPDKPGLRFSAPVSVVESMGSELYAYFDVEAGTVESSELTELAADAGMEDLPRHGDGDAQQVVARLDAASRARPGEHADMVLDTRHIQLFDPHGGQSLTLAE
jgi:multiple sugar transport system ATP-binding protein